MSTVAGYLVENFCFFLGKTSKSVVNGDVTVDPRSPTSPNRGAIREEAVEDPYTHAPASVTRNADSFDGEYFATFF